MFSKTCFFLVPLISLSCFGQVTIIGGTATTVGPSAAIVPLVSTPDIALPGSGSAVGSPLSSAAANDSRFSRGPSVYNPNATLYVVPATSGSGAGAVPEAVPTNSAAAQPFEFGIQHFESGSTDTGARPISLGQVARNYRSQPHLSARTYTNDSIAQMNAEAVTVGNIGTGSTTPSSTKPITVMAENRAPALPESDREIIPSIQSTARRNPDADQLRDRTPDQISPAPSSATPASASTTALSTASSESSNLPQTGSSMRLLLLIGGAGLLVGVFYWLRG